MNIIDYILLRHKKPVPVTPPTPEPLPPTPPMDWELALIKSFETEFDDWREFQHPEGKRVANEKRNIVLGIHRFTLRSSRHISVHDVLYPLSGPRLHDQVSKTYFDRRDAHAAELSNQKDAQAIADIKAGLKLPPPLINSDDGVVISDPPKIVTITDMAIEIYDHLLDVDTMELARNGQGILASKISHVRAITFPFARKGKEEQT